MSGEFLEILMPRTAKFAGERTQIDQANRIPDRPLKSLSEDRGKEMAQHKRFTLATNAAV